MTDKQLRTIIIIGIVVVALGIIGFFYYPRDMADQSGKFQVSPETEARKITEDFGRVLKNVSLLAPADALASSIRANYSPYLTPGLLSDWSSNPDRAIGREVSSPWPDRIEIERIQKISDSEYLVSGDIVEVTSATDILGGSEAARRDVDLTLVRLEDEWLINAVTVGSYEFETSGWQTYTDSESGLRLLYPTELFTKYISVAPVPAPSVTVSEGSLSCAETPDRATSTQESVARRVIGDQVFCVRSRSEGAAGSVFTEYSYTTEEKGRLVTGNFTLRSTQCSNYDAAEMAECQQERDNFDLDALIGQLADTLEFADD